MFTLFIIILTIIIIYSLCKKDKKDEYEVMTKLQSMPRIEIHSPNMDSFTKLFMEKSNSIETFIYDNNNLYISLRNGKVIQGNINQASISFSKIKTIVSFEIKLNGQSATIIEYQEQFDKETWRKIYDVLILGGVTQNKDIVENRFKSGSWFWQ